ncbi:MAG: hypothetical protein COW63_02780 [Bacteroidetes bacterium CG18_big_fil_WC_8_21_14_2_50_41_14]|nr:MAG: hypothetical protein COW63_02780 [Bacteroidetes bacterium CG18_big_fil_WC_8_21_14_2_50_41_14]
MTDQDYVENDRQVSPDSSKLLISYSIDLGAFGYGQAGTVVLKLSDTTKNLREFTIPNTLTRIKWIDSENVSAQFDILPSLRTGDQIELKDIEVNGIKVNVSALDYIDKDDRQVIEHREVSPNGQFELVAYRYLKDRSNVNFIHISVIPVGGQIPKYGNYLIADMQSDYVLYGTWTDKNELKFYSNSQYSDLIQYYLVKDREEINYEIVTDDKEYGSKYRWTKKSGI